MMHLAVLALAALQVPVPRQPPINAEVVFRVHRRYDGRTETRVPLRLPSSQTTYVIDSIRSVDPQRRIYTREMQVLVDAQGLATGVVERPSRSTSRDTALTRRLAARGVLIGGSAGVLFPEERLASVFRVLPAARLRAGARWSESIVWQTERSNVRASDRGTRTTTILRDTLIDGRVHWIVRDSSTVQRQEEWPEYSYSLLAIVPHTRQATGTLTGTWLYDPSRAIAVARADTLRMAGDITRTFPGGRSYTARYTTSRYDVWTAMSSQQYNDLRVAEIAEARKNAGGMVIAPRSPVEERLARGDSLTLDSLAAAWRAADVDSQLRIQRQLGMWRGARHAPSRRLGEAALQIGDTLSALERTMDRVRSATTPIDRNDLQFVVGYLEDPGRALRNGIGVDAAFNDIFNTLMNRPPALAHDTADVCGAGACELLVRYADRDNVDPRLRDLGIVTRYYQNPRDGFAALDARVASGTAFVQRVHRQALGYLYEYSRPGHGEPVPSPGADWSAWAAWGVTPNFPVGAVLRLHTIRTGRDFAREFQTGYASAQTDTARFVFGALLAEFDPQAFDSEQFVQLLTSSSPTLVRLGQRAVQHAIRDSRPAPNDLTAPLINGLIGALFENTPPPWQNAKLPYMRQSTDSSFVLSDSLPAAVQDRWRNRIKLISRADWNARDRHHEAAGYTITASYTGPFVILRYQFDGRLSRPDDAVPYLYAGGGMVVLLRTADGWREVSSNGWIT